MAYIRHNSLQSNPDSEAQPILCLDNETKNNVRFNSTKLRNSNSSNVIDAEEEFNNISREGLITVEREDGSKKTYYIECAKKRMVKFPTEDDLVDELCYEYKIFADENKKKLLVTFYRSYTGTNVSLTRALEVYDWLPKKLKINCEEIILSNQYSGESAGYVHPDYPTKIIILKPNDSDSIGGTLTHEMAHCYDISNGYVSNSESYITSLNNDLEKKLPNGDFSMITEDYFITKQAFNDYVGGSENTHENAHYAEDFADSVEMFLMSPGVFRWRYLNKANYLNELLS